MATIERGEMQTFSSQANADELGTFLNLVQGSQKKVPLAASHRFTVSRSADFDVLLTERQSKCLPCPHDSPPTARQVDICVTHTIFK